MVWVQRIIWVVLAVFSASVIWVVLSGGIVKDDAETEDGRAGGAQPAGEMAYDRYLPGGRQGQKGQARPD